jgi:hypothetical protein
MAMSDTLELTHNYKLIRDRLRRPPNAIKDEGIDLKRKRIPPCSLFVLPEKVIDHHLCKVTVTQVPRPPIEARIVKFRSVIKAVCDYFNHPLELIKGPSRLAKNIRPRHIIYYLAWCHTGLSLPQIGRGIGGRDHTTILHGRNKIRESMLVDEALAFDIRQIEYRLFAGFYDTDDNSRPALAALSQPAMAQQGQASLPQPEICSVD